MCVRLSRSLTITYDEVGCFAHFFFFFSSVSRDCVIAAGTDLEYLEGGTPHSLGE